MGWESMVEQPAGSSLYLKGATTTRRTISFPGPPTISNSPPTPQPRSRGLAIFTATFLLLFAVHSIRQQHRHFSSPLPSPLHPKAAMALELKNDSSLGTSDGLPLSSPRASASVTARYILKINVDPSALRAVLDTKLRYSTFTFFPKLPAELQLQIWERAVGKGPTMIVLPFDGKKKLQKKALLDDEVKLSGAVLLGVCRRSRDVATRVCMTITLSKLLLTRRTIKGIPMSATFSRPESSACHPTQGMSSAA